MNRTSRVATLYSNETVIDEYQQYIQKPVARKIFVVPKSITRTEFNRAGQLGLKPELSFETPAVNYRDEKVLQYEGHFYGIYRIFVDNTLGDTVTLYGELKDGEYKAKYGDADDNS